MRDKYASMLDIINDIHEKHKKNVQLDIRITKHIEIVVNGYKNSILVI